MGTIFEEGDRVVSASGHKATVTVQSQILAIDWDQRDHNGMPITGTWPAHNFTLLESEQRKFEVGTFVRVVSDDDYNGEVGFIFEDDGDEEDSDPYHIGFAELDESVFSASELIPWIPKIGERVIEADVDEDETGVVIGINDIGAIGGVDDVSVRVLWDSFPHAQNWLVGDLEPADEDDEDDTIRVGETVTYENPFFARPFEAVVYSVDDNIISVNFPGNELAAGPYHESFFSKAA